MKKGSNEEFPIIIGAAVGMIGFLMSRDFCASLGTTEEDSAAQLAHFQTAVTGLLLYMLLYRVEMQVHR